LKNDDKIQINNTLFSSCSICNNVSKIFRSSPELTEKYAIAFKQILISIAFN